MAFSKGFTCVYDTFGLVGGGVSACSINAICQFSFEGGAHEREVKCNVGFKFSLVLLAREHACVSCRVGAARK